jgi:hypothetical protein
MKTFISILILACSFSAHAAKTEKVLTKMCIELQSEAKQKFKQINHYTYQNNDKVIEFICGDYKRVGQITVYSLSEYNDIVSDVKQMQAERQQREQQEKENQMNKIRILYR